MVVYLLLHDSISTRIGNKSLPFSVRLYSQRDEPELVNLIIIPSLSSRSSLAERVRGLIPLTASCNRQNLTVFSFIKKRNKRGVHLSPIISVAVSMQPITVLLFMLNIILCIAKIVKRVGRDFFRLIYIRNLSGYGVKTLPCSV